MEEPSAARRANPGDRRDTPDFGALTPPSDLVRGDRTRDDFLDAVLQITEPATVDEVASIAGHGPDAAREYLDWFERMGIVTRVTASPATYQRNRAYLTWRRSQRLRETYEPPELVQRLETEVERDRTYADDFGVEAPDAVKIAEYAATSGRSIEAVWMALSDWKTTRRRITILERALAETNPDEPGHRRPLK